MNESETRAEYIDSKLKEAGWGDVEKEIQNLKDRNKKVELDKSSIPHQSKLWFKRTHFVRPFAWQATWYYPYIALLGSEM